MTTTPTQPATSTTGRQHHRRLVVPGLAAAAAAAVSTTLIAAICKAAGIDFASRAGEDPIPLTGFTTVTFVFSMLGVVLAVAFRRWSGRPATTFVRTTMALTAISLVPPLLIDVELASSAGLVLNHLVAATIVITVLARRLSD